LEKRWNTALTHAAELERRLEDATASAPQLTPEQREQLLALGDDLERLWDHPNSPMSLKKRILRTVLEEVIADTTDDPPAVHLKLHWAGGSHTQLTVRKNKTGDHNNVNSEEVTELIRELALICDDRAIVSILNRLGYRTGHANTWTEKRVQHVRHTKGFPACPLPEQCASGSRCSKPPPHSASATRWFAGLSKRRPCRHSSGPLQPSVVCRESGLQYG